jgi:putative membrane protein
MRWLLKIIIIIAGNAFGLWLAYLYVPGFVVTTDPVKLVLVALTLVLLNAILKPILTLIFGPVIILTLGLGIIVVNAAILLILQFLGSHLTILSGSISIQSIPALIYATLILGAVNFIAHLVTK